MVPNEGLFRNGGTSAPRADRSTRSGARVFAGSSWLCRFEWQRCCCGNIARQRCTGCSRSRARLRTWSLRRCHGGREEDSATGDSLSILDIEAPARMGAEGVWSSPGAHGCRGCIARLRSWEGGKHNCNLRSVNVHRDYGLSGSVSACGCRPVVVCARPGENALATKSARVCHN